MTEIDCLFHKLVIILKSNNCVTIKITITITLSNYPGWHSLHSRVQRCGGSQLIQVRQRQLGANGKIKLLRISRFHNSYKCDNVNSGLTVKSHFHTFETIIIEDFMQAHFHTFQTIILLRISHFPNSYKCNNVNSGPTVESHF